MIPDDFTFEDQGEDLSYCVGDIDPADVDWDKVAHIEDLIAEVAAMPTEADQNLQSVGVLHELYGEDLVVL